MIRRVIQIDQEKCDGCGLCASACHEAAIEIIDGKAQLVRDDYCDGFGDCLPSCPQGAISFIEREAAAYDEAAVEENKRQRAAAGASAAAGTGAGVGAGFAATGAPGGGCPGAAARSIERKSVASAGAGAGAAEVGAAAMPAAAPISQLRNWPVQIKLAPVQAPYFDGANLLIAADCCAYAYANFHQDFIRNKVCLLGCPKLDGTDYTEKLAEIIANNDVKSVTITRMEVPCCGGLEHMAAQALQASGKFIPWQVVTFSLDGRILD